jgi:hypothetical protein
MLRVEEGEPWVMWPDNLVANFIDYPANKIFDYNGEFEFKLVFELIEPIRRKSTLFSKLPSYFGIDLEEYGLLLIVTEDTKDTQYIFANQTWEVGKKYELIINKQFDFITITINGTQYIRYEVLSKLAKDDISHIILGAGNFPKNGFNLNYFSYILHYISIEKEGMMISEHSFEKFIHNKSYDTTNNCNFIHKI